MLEQEPLYIDNTINNDLDILSLTEAYSQLSGRESEVLKIIIKNKTNTEISIILNISIKTVENHITNIGSKLNLSGRGNLRRWAAMIIELCDNEHNDLHVIK